jgi:Xaa-Pro aminopeptidase
MPFRKGIMEIYKRRVERAQKLLASSDYDVMVLFLSSNMRYLSGFYDEPGERMLLFLIPMKGEPIFIVPELYEQQVKEASPFSNMRVWKDSDDPVELLKSTVADFAKGRVQVLVDDGMWASFFLMLREVLPDTQFSLASSVMRSLRMKKSKNEVRFLEKAGAIADAAFEEITGLNIEGMTELALAASLEEIMLGKGAEKIAFETLVASGPNSALPHHRAGKRKIDHGDVVVLDYGCRIQGYCSDITRTVVCGEASKRVREIYEIVERAQEKAVRVVRPGVEAQEVDRTAREEIARSGYGEQFIHRTGHGIGLDVHEEPYIVSGNAIELQEGMAFSVEPGIYVPGRFGIRIEDIVVVTQSGVTRMNCSTHTLHILG